MDANNEERIARFTAVKSENRYLEMKAKRPELTEEYIRLGKLADPEQGYQLKDAVTFVGECLDMCPEYEREEREYTNFLEPFEKIPGTDRVDHSKAVKRYKRSAAGDPPPLPCDVRPPPVLFKTLDYLFHDVISIHGVAASHSFVRDRARSIRNDLTLQNYRRIEAVELHEKIARYHIMCSNLLCGNPGFVMQQEEEQLRKTLLSLMEFYSELSKKGVKLPNEAEFQAYYILTLPWSNDVPSRLEQELPSRVFFDPIVQLAMEVRFLMARRDQRNRPSVDGSLNHFARIFSLVRKKTTSYLLACCIHLNFVDIRKSAIRAIQKSYHHVDSDPSSGTPLAEIIESLGFDNEDQAIMFLNHYYIKVGDCAAGKVACVGRSVITLPNGKQRPGPYPKFPYTIVPDDIPHQRSEMIEGKRVNLSYLDILNGKIPLPKSDVPAFVPKTPATSTFSSPGPILFRQNIGPVPKSFPVVQNGVFSSAHSLQNKYKEEGVNINPFSVKKEIKPEVSFNTGGFVFPPAISQPSATPRVQGNIPRKKKNSKSQSSKENSIIPAADFTKSGSAISTHKQYTPLLAPVLRQKTLEEYFYSDVTIQDLFFARILGPIMEETASEMVSVEAKKKHHLASEQALNIYSDILESLVKEVATERVRTFRKLLSWRFVLDTITNNLLEQTIREMSQKIIIPRIDILKTRLFLSRFAWDRWIFFVKFRKYEQQKQVLIGRKMVSYLRQSTLVPLESKSVAASIGEDSVDDMIESRLSIVAKEMAEKRATWYERILLNVQVFPQLSGPIFNHYKFIFCTCDTANKVTGTLAWFTDCWTRSKLCQSCSSDFFLPSGGTGITTLIDETFFYNNNNESSRVIVKYCDVGFLPSHTLAQTHNSESSFSGVNGIVFQCDYFSSKDYWSGLSISISKLANSLPLFSSVPLVLIYWPNSVLTRSQFAQQFERNIFILQRNQPLVSCGMFSKLSVLYQDVSADQFDSDQASTRLIRELVWIFENSKEPMLEIDIVAACDKICRKYEWAIKKISISIPKTLYPTTPAIFKLAENAKISIYNSFVKQLVEFLADDSYIQIPFPASEFASFPLDWNVEISFLMLRQMAVKYNLPLFSQNDEVELVLNLWVRYIDLLGSKGIIPVEELDNLKEVVLSEVEDPFFAISNCVFSHFAIETQLIYRPFDKELVQKRLCSEKESKPLFITAVHSEIHKFLNHDLVLSAISPKSRKRKSSEENGFPGNENGKEDKTLGAMEKLQRVMYEANLLLS